jgi:integrase
MLSAAVERYIALHRATGYRFTSESGLLRLFARHATHRGDVFVRSQTALEWAAEAPSSAGARRQRLHVVRRFARRMCAEDPRHEMPPPDAFGPVPPRRTPYIFAPATICRLIDGAAGLGPIGSLRPRTYATLLGLLACTGLRISEALALQLQDITDAGLVIRSSKFRKSRLVPLHDTTRRTLHAYLDARKRYAGTDAADAAVFLSERRTRLPYSKVNAIFLSLVRTMGIHPGPGKRGPRIHDLRHTFAVRSLEKCASDRQDVARHMLALSTYLGHARLAHTYWYLQATPLLLADVAAQSESLAIRGAR